MGSYFVANIRMKYAVVFIQTELESVFSNADDRWIKLEHSGPIRWSIQILCDTLTKLFCCHFEADAIFIKVVGHEENIYRIFSIDISLSGGYRYSEEGQRALF